MKTIKLLLTEVVDNLGIVGDVVSVKPGYARNYLIPRGIGVQPTEGSIKRLAARRAEVEAEMKRKRAEDEALLARLEGCEITIERACNDQGVLFGGVSQHDIAQALQAAGFGVDDRAVRIGVQIKRIDTYDIPIVLAQDLKTDIKLWVVSDRPLETDDDEDEESEAGEATVENQSASGDESAQA